MLDRSASNTIADANAAVLVSLDFGNSGYFENLEELRQLATSNELTIPAGASASTVPPGATSLATACLAASRKASAA